MNKNTKTALAVATGLTIAVTAGCASKQPNAALDSARATYERVSDETLQGAHSTEDLNVAKRKLDSANNAWKDKKDTGTINHRSYVAERYALIAEQRSELSRFQEKIENGNVERTRVQVDLRSAEARKAKQQAESLRKDVLEREAQLAKRQKELEELKALQAKNTDRGIVLTLGDVLFDTGESTLKPEARVNIERVASFLSNYPERSITIEGHTDNTGDKDSNYNLSVERAMSVRSALLDKGVEFYRIDARGLGEENPIASNSDASGRQQNRRVELIFDEQQDNISETVISVIDE